MAWTYNYILHFMGMQLLIVALKAIQVYIIFLSKLQFKLTGYDPEHPLFQIKYTSTFINKNAAFSFWTRKSYPFDMKLIGNDHCKHDKHNNTTKITVG